MSTLTCTLPSYKHLVRGSTLHAVDEHGRRVEVRILSFTHGAPEVLAWDATAGRQVLVIVGRIL